MLNALCACEGASSAMQAAHAFMLLRKSSEHAHSSVPATSVTSVAHAVALSSH